MLVFIRALPDLISAPAGRIAYFMNLSVRAASRLSRTRGSKFRNRNKHTLEVPTPGRPETNRPCACIAIYKTGFKTVVGRREQFSSDARTAQCVNEVEATPLNEGHDEQQQQHTQQSQYSERNGTCGGHHVRLESQQVEARQQKRKQRSCNSHGKESCCD
eukprot:6209257-Pleurochrysis_carterae.AAC.3